MKPLSGDEINQVGAYLETLAIRGAVWLDPDQGERIKTASDSPPEAAAETTR